MSHLCRICNTSSPNTSGILCHVCFADQDARQVYYDTCKYHAFLRANAALAELDDEEKMRQYQAFMDDRTRCTLTEEEDNQIEETLDRIHTIMAVEEAQRLAGNIRSEEPCLFCKQPTTWFARTIQHDQDRWTTVYTAFCNHTCRCMHEASTLC